MTSRDFAYWLQGYFEVSNPRSIGPHETDMIKKHLSLVFVHEIDPSMGPEEHQEKLDDIHQSINSAYPTNQYTGTCGTSGQSGGVEMSEHGPCPGEGYKLSTLHGWYLESEGIPRC